jgi:inward rectifier potassium channel
VDRHVSDKAQNRPLPGNAPIPARGRVAVVKGQDASRYTDFYHAILMAPWWLTFVALFGFFVTVNLIFASLYLADPQSLKGMHPGDFWNAFLFSVETIGSINYTVFVPQTAYANVVVSFEAFAGILMIALFTGIIFARFSRPFARVVFSRVAVITPFDGVPTLMFRTANQRGNQVLDASMRVTLAYQQTTREGLTIRRFTELKLVRERTALFALSWTLMHHIDEASPLHGLTLESMREKQMEIIAMLSGTDDTMAEQIYSRHAYQPGDILWNRHFVDVLSMTPTGKRVVDLTRFHDTEEVNLSTVPLAS